MTSLRRVLAATGIIFGITAGIMAVVGLAAAWVAGGAAQPAWAQSAQSEPGQVRQSAHVQHVQAGPYNVTIHYTQWPVRSKTNQRFIIEVDGGIRGKAGRWAWIRYGERIGADVPRLRRMDSYPGIDDAWVIDIAGMVDPGEWIWVIEISGPLGRGFGASERYEVLDPPGFPIWLGWVVGLFPIYGLIWFAVREARRTLAQIAQDGGARA